jgi:hypothetical protein
MKLDEIIAGSLSEEALLDKMMTDLRTLKEGISSLEKFDADTEVICIELRAMIGMLARSYQKQLECKQRLRVENEKLRQ